MKDKKYSPYEAQAGTNSVICGAELESTHFHVTADGYRTDVSIGIIVNYVQGKQADIRRVLVNIPFGNSKEEEVQVGTDNLTWTLEEETEVEVGEREPDKSAIDFDFEIIDEASVGTGSFSDNIS